MKKRLKRNRLPYSAIEVLESDRYTLDKIDYLIRQNLPFWKRLTYLLWLYLDNQINKWIQYQRKPFTYNSINVDDIRQKKDQLYILNKWHELD